MTWTHHIMHSPLFWIVLFIKLVASACFGSTYLTSFFIPFLEHYVANPTQNPYQFFWQNGDAQSFPYPAFMLYFMALPRLILYWIGFDQLPQTILLLVYRLPLLIADLCIFLILCRWLRQKVNTILWLYWCSPVLFYISYIHGQLDVIPVALQFLCIFYIISDRKILAACVLGLALATKTQSFLILPFAVIFLWQIQSNIKAIVRFLIIALLVFIFVNLPFLASQGFLTTVFHNPQQDRIWHAAIEAAQGQLRLYIIPALLLLLIIYSLYIRLHNRDQFLIFIGFAFGAILIFVVPSPGWYFWVIPFFIYFFCQVRTAYLYPFLALQFFYLCYFALSPISDFTTVFQWSGPNNIGALYRVLQNTSLPADRLVNLTYTCLVTFMLLCCCIIYYRGIYIPQKNSLTARPFMLGIAGDSGAGKSTITEAMLNLFGERYVTAVCGDDMHKWQRGDAQWSSITHLDPRANDLHSELHYINALRQSHSIKRRHYDHNSGQFTEDILIHPKPLTILEGLHTFYLRPARPLFDLKIFVKPDMSLLLHRKVIRDMQKRQYSKDEIIEAIKGREADSKKYITTQERFADIIISTKLKNPIRDSDIGDPSYKIEEWLGITLSNAYYLDPLLDDINGLRPNTIRHSYDADDRQTIDFLQPIDIADMTALAEKHMSGLAELGIYYPNWKAGWLGIIQLIICYCIFYEWNANHDD